MRFMMTAKEARRKTLLSTKLKKSMDIIEKEINKAVSFGLTHVSVQMDIKDDDLILTLSTELESLGYKVVYEPAKPLPPGCPSDQWDFWDYLKISWEE